VIVMDHDRYKLKKGHRYTHDTRSATARR
jgi:hypothetical protein